MLTPFRNLYSRVVQNLFVTKSEPDRPTAMGEHNMDIEIIQITDPWNFLACEKPESSKSPESQEFQQMHKEMNEHCNHLLATEFRRSNVGDVCAALCRKDNLWHRVRIERIMSQSHGQLACCYMIDKGSQMTVSTLRIMRLPQKFVEFPYQVHHCYLWGVQPVTLKVIETDTGLQVKSRPCSKWDPAAIEYMQTMVDGSQGCQAEVIHKDSENNLFLRLYLITENGLVCFNEALVEENYAVKVDTTEFCTKHESLTGSSSTDLIGNSPGLVPCRTTNISKAVQDHMPTLMSHLENAALNNSLPKLKDVDNFSFTARNGLSSIDKQEKCNQQLRDGSSISSVQNKSEPSMNSAPRKSPNVLQNTESKSNLRSLMHDRSCATETEQVVLGQETSPLVSSSKLAKLSSRRSPSAASSETVENVCLGRGRGTILAKISTPPYSTPNNSFKKDNQTCILTSKSPSPGRSTENSSLVTRVSSTNTDSVAPPSINDQNKNISRLKNLQRLSNSATSPTSLSNFKVSPSHDQGRSMGKFALCDNKGFSNTLGHGDGYSIPTITRQDQPIPRPIFGVVVHGKGIPELICDVDDIPFKDCVKSVMSKMKINTARSIQAWVWPAVLSCRHIVGICPPNLGKTMSYVPGIVSLVLDQSNYIELPPGKGPLALVIVPSWKKGRNVLEMVEDFTFSESRSHKPVKSIVLYAGGVEENENNQISLMQGCDILIATPKSLLRMLDQEITSLKRLCHIILDDAEILAKRFAKEVEAIMQLYKLQLKDRREKKKCSCVPKQIMMFSTQWNSGLEEFYLKYTVEPIIAISSRVEASVYGGVKQVVTMTKWENRLTTFCGLLDMLSTTRNRVAAFTENVDEAKEMCQAAKSRGVYCLLIHENLLSESIAEAREQWFHSSHSKNMMVMVCTDQCYQDLAITNSTMVIHYGLPGSKTKFGNRLACMLDYFLDRTSANKAKPKIEPVSQVILTNKCAAKAQSLYEILKRCPSEHSPQLEKFLQGYKMAEESDVRKILCPFLKSFGKCSLDRCEHRHAMLPEQDFKTGEVSHNSLPSSGEVKIKVLRVENASQFYCHLIEHRSVPDNVRTDLRLEYQRLVMEMVSFFSKETNHAVFVPSKDPFYDDICAFKDNNNIFYRAKVLEVHPGSGSVPTEVKVWLVDAGYHKIITIDQLLRLPERLANIPYQAVEVYLCCVKPKDSDSEWTFEANTFVNNLIQGKELVGRIMLRVGMALWLLPLVHQVTLKPVGVTNDLNIKQEVLGNKFGTPNPEHIQKLYELFRGHVEIPEKLMRQYFDYALEMEMIQESLTGCDTFNEVIIAAVVSPGLLYVQKWDNFELLEQLESQIADAMRQKHINNSVERCKADADIKLERGSVCLALSSDGSWYRGKIVSDLTSGLWSVFFIDYGDREKVSECNIHPLPRELAELPCQAIECELAYIQPLAGNWERPTVDVICDLAYYVNGDKKQLYAKVVNKIDPHFSIGQKLVIDLYDGDVRFSQELVWRHMAKSAEDSDTIKDLIGKPALKSQLFFNSLDKIPYLCANIYWCETHADAIQQARELCRILSCRDDGWESRLIQRNVMTLAFRVVGYIPDVEAHETILDNLVSCCLDSDRLTEIAISENFASRLAFCLEQVSRPRVQLQAAQGIARLVSKPSFTDSLVSGSYLVMVLSQFLNKSQISHQELETLKFVCTASSHLVQATDESVCAELMSAEMVEQIFTSLKQSSTDTEREPWLKLLAAIATCESSHKCLMREAHVPALLDLLLLSSCVKCQYYLLFVCQKVVERSRKHKLVLLENKLLIILNDLESGGLRTPALEICKQLQSEMSLTLPRHESLAGVPAYHVTEVSKIVTPSVTWSQNCFRLTLDIKVRDAQVEDFLIAASRICCSCVYEGVQYKFDWELYDTILPEISRVDVFASHSLMYLKKQTKGIWCRLLKQKVKIPKLQPDFEHLYDSADEDVEDERNMAVLTKKKDLFNQEEIWKVKRVREYQSSDESSEELAHYSHSSDDEPVIDINSLMSSKIL